MAQSNITVSSLDQIVRLGSRLRAGGLATQGGYTLALVAEDRPALTQILGKPFLDEAAAVSAKVVEVAQDRALARDEAKVLCAGRRMLSLAGDMPCRHRDTAARGSQAGFRGSQVRRCIFDMPPRGGDSAPGGSDMRCRAPAWAKAIEQEMTRWKGNVR